MFVAKSAVNSVNRPDTSQELALTIAQHQTAKAGDIVVLRVAEVSYLSDYFVMATGYSRVQVRAISEAIEDKVEQEGRRPLRTEGQAEGTVCKTTAMMVHMMPKEREFYNLEAFWAHAER